MHCQSSSTPTVTTPAPVKSAHAQPLAFPAPDTVKVARIIAYHRRNDPASIAAGGPEKLEMEFYVPEISIDSLVQYVRMLCNRYRVPVQRVYHERGELYLPATQAWTRKQIEERIKQKL